MKNNRKHGTPPYEIVTIHGGPGAAGKMDGISREISRHKGVLEALQSEKSINGQIAELHSQIMNNCQLPVILIGHSWGAWLGYLFAAFYPGLVKKLILISAGPFEEKYIRGLMDVRLNRLSIEKQREVKKLRSELNDENVENKNERFSKLGILLTEADSYKKRESIAKVECRYDIYESVWTEAHQLRKSGRLLDYAEQINCKVVAFHGDFDPHPANGVKVPLQLHISEFDFHLLEKCGHTPWLEEYAHKKFYDLLMKEIL